jgi:hypothetical protein
MEVGLVLSVLLIIILCCCGWGVIGALTPHPAPVYPMPVPSSTY